MKARILDQFVPEDRSRSWGLYMRRGSFVILVPFRLT